MEIKDELALAMIDRLKQTGKTDLEIVKELTEKLDEIENKWQIKNATTNDLLKVAETNDEYLRFQEKGWQELKKIDNSFQLVKLVHSYFYFKHRRERIQELKK